MRIPWLVLAGSLALAPAASACSRDNPEVVPPGAVEARAPASIGFATIDASGTLVLDLHTYDERAGGRVYAHFVYPRDHEKYAEVLAHVSPIRPGERKPVKPWP
jgi:hypothetical protein